MKQISDMVSDMIAGFFENKLFALLLAGGMLSFCISMLTHFIGEETFSFVDIIRDLFFGLKQLLSKAYERFKAWWFKYQTDDQDIAE